MTTKQPPSIPQSREAEEAVIGAVLINPVAYLELIPFLQADDFFIHRNRFIWQAFNSMFDRNIPIDNMTLFEELNSLGQIEDVGGAAYITKLISNVPSSLNAVHYGQIVKKHAMRRRMLEAANEIATLATNEELDPIEAHESAIAAVYDVSGVNGAQEFTLHQSIADIFKQSFERAEKGTLPGIPTGFIDLDKILKGGLQNGRLYLVAGRTGIGKTAEVLDFAVHAATKHAKYVRIFSQEMGYEEVGYRIAAKITGIDENSLEIGALEEKEWQAFADLIEQAKGYNLVIDETKPLTPLTLRSICQRLHMRGLLDLVIVDYIQLLPGRGEKRYEQVGDVSRQLKLLARDLSIPVVAAAQLSRNTEQRADRRPVLSDLRESGNLEQDSDVVIFLWEDPEYQNKNIITNIVAKHRNGPTGELQLVFRASLTKFENAAIQPISLPDEVHQGNLI